MMCPCCGSDKVRYSKYGFLVFGDGSVRTVDVFLGGDLSGVIFKRMCVLEKW